MTQDYINKEIIGNWDVFVQTPFGVSKAAASIKSINPSVSGSIIGENGSIEFDNGSINENILTFSTDVNTPIKATIKVNVEIEGTTFTGSLMIDEYLKISIRGVKNVNL